MNRSRVVAGVLKLSALGAVALIFAADCGALAADVTDAKISPVSSVDTAPADSAPASCSETPRAGDQIWLISTRGLGCPTGDAPTLQVSSYDGHTWVDSTVEQFLKIDNTAETTDFYIHGNFDSTDEAVQNGWAVYQKIAHQAPAGRSMRFVIWSWPSDRERHPLRTTRENAHRADVDGYYLGWLLSRMDRRAPIGLIGYSFGARVATGALHVLGGGQLLGLTVATPAPPESHPKVRAVLMAAAEDCDWLAPGHPNELAVPTVERMMLLNNSCDAALKRYRFLDRCSRAEALGYVGMSGVSAPDKIETLDACCAVGPEHSWANYFYDSAIVGQMLPYLYLDAAAR